MASTPYCCFISGLMKRQPMVVSSTWALRWNASWALPMTSGARVIDSTPPAMAKSISPERLPCAFMREFRCRHRRGQTTMSLLSDQPIFTIRSPLGDIQKLGYTPYGERRIINILGGTVDGPKLKGRILPGGADWQIVRADGVVHLQARYIAETETGGRIVIDAEGYRHGPGDGTARPRRDRGPIALLLPHLHAVRDRGSGNCLAQPRPGHRPWRPREQGGADRGLRGALVRLDRPDWTPHESDYAEAIQ